MKNLLLIFLLILLPIKVCADESGTCGENLTWTYEEDTQTLTITGTGVMYDYSSLYNGNYNYKTSAPWRNLSFQTVIIKNGVTSIGKHAFLGCSTLISIDIPNSVTSIKSYSFSGCSSLTYVSIPNSVATIEDYTFYGCWSIISIEIPISVMNIKASAFGQCSSLTNITIPNSVTSIGYEAFYGCHGLTSVKIGNSVTNIGDGVFNGCSSLNTITVASENTNYDSRNNCNAIIETSTNTIIRGCRNTVIPNTVTCIGNGAFSDCTSLTSIDIPNSVTSIGSYAFSMSGLTSIVIPNSVEYIGEDAFMCGNLKTVTINSESIMSQNYSRQLSFLHIFNSAEEFIIGDNIKSIGQYAFYNCMETKTVIIPNSVTSIGNYAFWGCSSLTSVAIPNNVKNIGTSLFQDCSSLLSMEIPNSVVSIGDEAFKGCTSLSYFEIPNSVTSIGYRTFDDCPELKTVFIDNDSLVSSKSSIVDCFGYQVEKYIIGDHVKSIGESAFSCCLSMTSIEIPNSVTSIGNSAFHDCVNLTSITIPSSVTSIGNGAFIYCYSLTSITIPSSVVDIDLGYGHGAFNFCSNLTSINVEPNNTRYDSRNNCNAIIETASNTLIEGCKNTVIPNSVTSIRYYAFMGSSLTSIDIPNSVTNIGGRAFEYCQELTSVIIPNSVKSIEGYAFSYCDNLSSVTMKAPSPISIRSDVFTNRANATLYVPYGSKSAYETAAYWKEFKEIIEDELHISVGDIITYEGLQYQVTKVEDDGNEVTLIKNPDAQGEINIPSIITDENGTVGFTVTAIEDYAFYNCANITKLSIPASVQSIGKAITSCCTILNEITVAENNPYYDSRDNCNAVINTSTGELLAGCNKTTIPEGVTAIGVEAMRGMFDLEGIVLPSTLTRIGNRAFYYCKKLTGHLAIPEGVTEVETYAFYKCTGLTAISLPSTITTLGTCAFRECSNVTWVGCRAVTPPSIDSRMFGKFAGCTLMVPIGSVDTYKAATNWKKFDPIIRESVVSVEDVAILTGNKGTARISLDNGTNVYTGCQFNITLPEGTDLVKQTHGGYEYTISNRFSGTPSVQITPQEDGSYMVLIYSMNSTAINGSEGVLISLPVKVVTGLPAGDYLGTITKIAFNNPDNTSAYLHDVTFNITMPSFVLGDVNHDRTVNITDVMMTVNHVVGQTPAGFHVEDADVNGDHVINISDIMAIVNLVVNATSANAPAHAREAMTDAISLMPTTQGYAIALQNIELYTALQMDIQLKSDASFNARLADNRSDGHCIICSDLGNGYHRIAIYSLNGHAIKGNDGILLQLETNGKHDAQPEVTNVQLTNRLFESVTLSDISFPTDITNIDEDGVNDSPAYNVQGIRMPKHHHGILIQNGKKQIEKR